MPGMQDVSMRRGSGARDPETKFLNPQSVADYSRRLAQRVGEVLDQGDFALVLGGL